VWPCWPCCCSAGAVCWWGHPFELLIWLRWFLNRLNGGPSQYANGRIVLAAIGYWLLIGLPAEILLFLLRLGVDPVKALGLGLKEAVVSVLSVALGLVAYVLFTAWRYRGRKGQISARGITFATVLPAVSLPGVLITIILSSQLKTTALQGQLQMALANLIRNALQAISLAGVTEPRLRLSIHHRQDAHASSWLELPLADNGPGFSDLQLEQLLLASTKPQGSGLGLFVVNAAVQIHGGCVQLTRHQGSRSRAGITCSRVPSRPSTVTTLPGCRARSSSSRLVAAQL
jgi:hypothetical protein